MPVHSSLSTCGRTQRENKALTNKLQTLSVELEKEKKKPTVINRPAPDAVEEVSDEAEEVLPVLSQNISWYTGGGGGGSATAGPVESAGCRSIPVVMFEYPAGSVFSTPLR